MRWFCAILLGLILCNPAAADERWGKLATPYFSHIGRENGLPHDIVMDLAQTPDGFVWLATQGGLARWDGYRSRVFAHVDGDPGSLPDSTILRLLVDESGRLWVATISGMIARYDPVAERFETLPVPGGGIGVPGGLVDDGAGGIWVGGTDGLAHFAPDGWHRDSRIAGDASAAIRCLMRGRDGTLWVCGTTRLFRMAPHGTDLVAVETPPGADPLRALTEDDRGRIWFGTDHAGLGLLDPATGGRQLLVPPDPALAPIRELAPSGPDEIWAVTAGTGIVAASTTGAATRITSRDGLRSALGTDTLYAVMRDRSGMLWVGGLGGAWFHPAGPGPIDTVWPAPDPQHGPWGADVLSLCAGTANRIWLGTLKSGLLTLAPPAAKPPAIERADPNGAADAAILDCAVTPDGTVFAGQRKGLLRITPGQPTATIETLDPPALDTAGPARSLFATAGELWIGTDAGLYRADPHGQILQHYQYGAEDPDSLSNNSVEVMTGGASGALWVGTHVGLNRLDVVSGKVERIQSTPAADALPGPNISSLLFDRRGRLWVGTIGGGGIGVLEHPEAPGPRRFRRIGLAEGMPTVNIGALLEDGAGRIWASSTDGLIVIDPDTLHPRALGPADGVVIRSYWAHSGIKLSDGTLLFGGLKGVSAVRPDLLKDWSFDPAVVASAVRVDGRAVAARQPIELHPGDRSLQVEFASLDFSAPEHNRYAYQLTGYDSDWVTTDSEHRLAAYTNLPPGEYTLLLRGTNRVGAWTEPPTALSVHVLPAWYQTWWFRLLAAAGFLAILGGIVQLRTLQLARHQRELEREVARRTVELERSQQALERSNATLAASAETLRKLGEIGRGITASLDMDHVFASLCGNIGAMLEADSIAIWLLDDPPTRLKLGYGIEDGRAMPPLVVPLDAPDRGVARAARERQEIMLDYSAGSSPPIPGTKPMATALFGPLMVNDRLLGVLTVQSERANAYGERERLAFTSLCAYGATGLANAEAHRELARANAELGRLASKDTLTGLANRHRFFVIASEEVARAHRYQRSLSVIVADLDMFKRVNDTYGHAAGDAALQIAALCLGQCLRATDLAARFGGEEFIALMPETTLDGATQVAERFRDLLARTAIRHNEISFPITVSIGVSTWLPGETAIEAAIERADMALYRVKRGGRNAVAIEVAVPPEP
jgi:diguanylate cyclase (GGDEF)-like protein